MAYRPTYDDSEKDREFEYGSDSDMLDAFALCSADTAEAGLPEEVCDEVVRHYSPLVWRIALTKTRSTHDAEDVFQDVFMKLAMNEKPFASETHRKAWLIRVTVNCCNSHFVAPWRKNVDILEDAVLSQIPDEDSASCGGGDGTPDVYAQVLRLPQNMREVILLFYYENMSVRQIAQTLQISEVNVKKRLSRARQKLRLELDGNNA